MIEGHGDDLYRYDGLIRMNFSSNIYYGAALTRLKEHLAARLSIIGSYPEPQAVSLERMIAARHGIPADCVMVTAGATEAIYLVAQAFGRGPSALPCYAVRRPTFSEYDDACAMFGYTEIGWSADASGDGGNGVLRWICNPNNPTGEVLPPDAIAAAAARGGITVVDQSYEDYTLAPVLTPSDALRLPGVLLLHSMTKTYAVPGLRLGYITASSELIAVVRRCARPWAVNALAIEAGMFLLSEGGAVIPCLRDYIDDAQRLRHALDDIPWVSVTPTSTGFMLAETSRGTAAELKEYLAREHGMLIRDCSNFRGLSSRHFRVAARSHGDNMMLVDAIRRWKVEGGRLMVEGGRWMVDG